MSSEISLIETTIFLSIMLLFDQFISLKMSSGLDTRGLFSKNSWRSLLIETVVFGTITFMVPVMIANRARADDVQQGEITGSVNKPNAGNATSFNNASIATAASMTATQLDNNQSNSGTIIAAVSSESVTTGASIAVSAVTTQKNRLMICRMRPHKQCSQVSKQAHQRLLRKLRNRDHLQQQGLSQFCPQPANSRLAD
ncbi:hypothetical protein [uncultured Fructobacillus sp.]|uniref:hypothetical protein n=1 Tax=uncultured Fructobacillus sp. TaxID=591942 RepID=UPI0025931088|nr:hypothetical protein [uncultured Fructobacillus sp.]